MASTFTWYEDNGPAIGSPPHGTTSASVTNVNWKNIDDTTTAYTSAPITAGNNSYQKNQYGVFTGTFAQITSGLFAHTGGTFGTGVALVGVASATTAAGPYAYVTPSTTADSGLPTSMTTPIAIGSGVTVWFGPTGPQTASKAASSTANPTYTNYLTTQLQTTGSALPGDTSTQTMTLEWTEH